MKIESIVKVMNFHSLLRVDSSKKAAEKYFEYEKELTNFVDNIVNNRNLILDKRIISVNKNGKILNIYIANDLGFCGNFNSNVSKKIKEDVECDKIIIGKKIIKKSDDVVFYVSKEEYKSKINDLQNLIYDSIVNNKYSEVNIIYNHYYNISNIKLVTKKLLPFENIKEKKEKYKEDFIMEGDINDILLNIIVLYIAYEIKIATENSYASENIMRQMLTKESLRKIKEIKEEKIREERKYRKTKNFKKSVENSTKMKNDEEE